MMTAVENALRITTESEVIRVATEFAAEFATGASARDSERRLPDREIADLAQSGLLAITVPREFGGIDVSTETLTQVFRILAGGDPSIAQIPHSHFTFLEVLRSQGDHAQQQFFFSEVLAGRTFANAQSERGSLKIDIDTTTLTRTDDGYVLDGKKFYSTGALFADWIAVRASMGGHTTESGAQVKSVAYLRRDTPGITIVDDWDGMGQKTTGSGTVALDAVAVPDFNVVPFTPIFAGPTTYGAQAQILHAAIDVGIACASLTEAVECARKARPYFESGVDEALDDPLLINLAGDITITVASARALLAEGARRIDAARAQPTDESTALASIAAATAKVVAARAALEASNTLFELGGTRSASESGNRARFWRDARTHTLHDPTRWKVQHIGRWTLSGTRPPRHGLL